MNYQARKRHGGNLNVCYSEKLIWKRLQSLWFQLNEIMEKSKTEEVISVVGKGRGDEQMKYRRF